MTLILNMPMQDDAATSVIDDISTTDVDGVAGANTEDITTDGPGDPYPKALTVPATAEWGQLQIANPGGSPPGITTGSIEFYARLSDAEGLYSIFSQTFDVAGPSLLIDADELTLQVIALNDSTSLLFDLPPALDVTAFHKYVVVLNGNAGELLVDDVSAGADTCDASPGQDFLDFGFLSSNLGAVDGLSTGPFDICGLRVTDTATYPPSPPVVLYPATFLLGVNLTGREIVATVEAVFSGYPTPVVTYQWQRANNASGSGAANIALNGTSASYTPVAADIGKFNRRLATATNADGSATSNSSWIETFESVALPSAEIIEGEFDSLTAFDGLFIIDDHTVSDSISQAMPDPVAWESDSPQSAVDFSFHAVAAGSGRTNTSGATAISASFCVVAKHAAPTVSVEFNTLAGVKTTRSIDTYWDIIGDLRVIKLSSTLPAGVMRAKFFRNSSQMAGRQCLAIECNRHLSRHTVSESLSNSVATILLEAETVDVIEGGDSGHAVFLLVGGVPVLVIGGFSAATPGNGTSSGVNVAMFFAEIQAILAASGESLTLVNLTSGTPSGAILSAINSPIRSAIGNPSDDEE